MALARIITRSHQYAQQLAFDLLARGYTVEIVSPDATPTNPADLELRVEASGADLQGQVTEVREHGKPSKSIEYLQWLKPMMADLLRRWPSSSAEPAKDIEENSNDFSFNTEPAYPDDMERPATEYEPPAPSAFKEHESVEDPELVESAELVSRAPAEKPSTAPSIFSITGEPIIWAESEPERRGRSEVWFWRAAVGFASLALVILVLGMALRRGPTVAARPALDSAAQPNAAAQTVATTVPPAPAKAAAPSTSLPARTVLASATPATSGSKTKPSAVIHRTRVGRQNDEGVNGDTTITYFNTKAAEQPKPVATRGSGIKHYSDMN